MRTLTIGVALGTALGLVGSPLARALSYDVTIQSPHPPGQTFQILNSPTPQSLSLSYTTDLGNGSFASTSATSAAGPGSLGGATSALLVGGDAFPGSSAVAQEYSDFSGLELTISGPAGAVTPFSVNFDFDGSLTVAATPGTGWYAAASVGASGSISGPSGGYGLFPGGGIAVDSNGGYQATGIFAGITGLPSDGQVHAQLTSNTFSAHAGDTFIIFMTINTLAQVSCGYTCPPGSATASADFAHTLSLAASGAVFNLDPGFTVNSTDGCIANNVYLCATAPEPQADELELEALAVVAFCAALPLRSRGFAPV